MNRRLVSFFLAFSILCSAAAADDAADSTSGSSSDSGTSSSDGAASAEDAAKTEGKQAGAASGIVAEPYKASEFSPWMLDLRRAEIVAFGSLPFTVFFVQTVVETYRCSQHDWDRAYAPWPVKTTGGVSLSSEQFLQTFTAGCIGAVVFALVDHLIVTAKRNKAKRAQEERPAASYSIERSSPDQGQASGETPIPVDPPPTR